MKLLFALLLLVCSVSYAFRPKNARLSFGSRSTSRTSSLHLVHDPTLLVSAALDYSAEIENAVGTEVYTPIFKAGLTLFASGILTAFAAAFIISKADTFGDLADEFEQGKKTQLIASSMINDDENKQNSNSVPAPATTQSSSAETGSATTATQQKDLKGLDL